MKGPEGSRPDRGNDAKGPSMRRRDVLGLLTGVAAASAANILISPKSLAQAPNQETEGGHIMELVGGIDVEVETPFDPKRLFAPRNTNEIWVKDEFGALVTERAEYVPRYQSKHYSLHVFELTRDFTGEAGAPLGTTDSEILHNLPNGVFDANGICAVLAYLIQKQPKGEKGLLTTNGRSNIFPSKDFVALATWDPGDFTRIVNGLPGKWILYAYKRRKREQDQLWPTGIYRVFAPAPTPKD